MVDTVKPITLDMVQDKANEIIVRFGEGHKNPRATDGDGHETCVYTNQHGQHCFAGQILTDLGGYCPDYGDGDNMAMIHQLFGMGQEDFHGLAEDAVDFLALAQEAADEDTTWSSALQYAYDNMGSFE